MNLGKQIELGFFLKRHFMFDCIYSPQNTNQKKIINLYNHFITNAITENEITPAIFDELDNL